jgi:dimethylsulfoniopropionate demethylase
MRSLAIDGDAVAPCRDPWPVVAGGKIIGRVTSAAWSPDFATNVAIGMIRMTHWDDGTNVEVETPDGVRTAVVREKAFI